MKQRPSLNEEVQQWERTLKSGSPADRAAFVAWIRRSPEHLDAYLRNISIETELQGLDEDSDFDIDALLKTASANVVQLSSGAPVRLANASPSVERPKRWRLLAAVAAGSAVAVWLMLAGTWKSTTQWADYTTDIGEQRRFVLTDGSIIELNTKSHIRVSMQPKSREVDLISGEALFSVQHNANRPFRVRVGDQVVEDVGTQFAVYLRPDAITTVSVLDGRVQISASNDERTSTGSSISDVEESGKTPSTELAAGEEIRIAANGKLINRSVINVNEAASWREHRLWFDGVSLVEVAAEFNRYNKRQLHIQGDPAVLKKRYTGTFDAYDPDSFVQVLQDDPALTVLSNEGELLIRAR